MKSCGVFAVTVGLLLLGGTVAYAQANLSNNQLAEQLIRCRQGQGSTAGDCGAVQAEFNRRAGEVRQQDVRIQRGEAVPAANTAPATATPASSVTPASAPARPAARPAPPRNAPNLSGSEEDANCAGRQVIPVAGGYMCM
jgi:hypothetical protein